MQRGKFFGDEVLHELRSSVRRAGRSSAERPANAAEFFAARRAFSSSDCFAACDRTGEKQPGLDVRFVGVRRRTIFGARRARQIARYEEFVQQGVDGASIWRELKGQVFLGTDAFAEAMQRRLEQDGKQISKEIPRLQRRALAKSLNYYCDTFDDKKQGMAAAYATGDYTLQQVADAFAVHYATVSRAVNGK